MNKCDMLEEGRNETETGIELFYWEHYKVSTNLALP